MGGTGRLGEVVCRKLRERGDTVFAVGKESDILPEGVNYIVFCQRYRGEPSWSKEYFANAVMVDSVLARGPFGDGDCAAVAVSSVLALRVGDQGPSYHASKAALEAVARCHAARGPVRVNMVAAGPFTGASPVVTVDEVANAVVWLASAASRGINGARIVVDNGAGLEW